MVTNHLLNTLFLECSPGEDNGHHQRFVAEIYQNATDTLCGNLTSDTPSFVISNLSSAAKFTLVVYSYNIKGRSPPVILFAQTLAAPEKHVNNGIFFLFSRNEVIKIIIKILFLGAETEFEMPISTILIILIAFIVIVVLMTAVILISIIRANRRKPPSTSTSEDVIHQAAHTSMADDEDKCEEQMLQFTELDLLRTDARGVVIDHNQARKRRY